jgi:hypothetical protein|nr:MAG TPA: mHsp60, mHsp10, Mitochondrial, Chaperonin, Complex, Symmetric [Crassvirales sp.]
MAWAHLEIRRMKEIKTKMKGLLIKSFKPSFNHVVVSPVDVDVLADSKFKERNIIMKYLDPKITPMRVVYVGTSVRTCEPGDIVLVNIMRHFRGEGEQAHIELPALEIGGVECLIVTEGDLYGVAEAEILETEITSQNELATAAQQHTSKIIVPDKRIIL